jgi:hypothetical protein
MEAVGTPAAFELCTGPVRPMAAYDVFSGPGETGALKVALSRS